MYLACKQGQLSKTHQFARPIAQLTAALFRESNPAPVKYALSMLGLMSAKVRLPLVELNEPSRAAVVATLERTCDAYSDYMIGSLRTTEVGALEDAVAG